MVTNKKIRATSSVEVCAIQFRSAMEVGKRWGYS
jgi:hypothetical protein